MSGVDQSGVPPGYTRVPGYERYGETAYWIVEYTQRLTLSTISNTIRCETAGTADELAEWMKADSDYSCVRVTGPHKQLVPAD